MDFEYSQKRTYALCYFYFEIVHRHIQINLPNPMILWFNNKIQMTMPFSIRCFKICHTTPGPLLVRENGRLRSPHYWKSALLESYYRNIAKTHYWESYIMYYGRNVYFLNPHYREIRTMGGRTNRGPGVLPGNLGWFISKTFSRSKI